MCSAITRLNRLEFTHELHLWISQCLRLHLPAKDTNDDIVDFMLDMLTFNFLDEEVERCDKFGHKLILDDMTKQKAMDFVLLKYPKILTFMKNAAAEANEEEVEGLP